MPFRCRSIQYKVSAGGGEDFVKWVAVKPLCCKLKTNVRLYIDTSVKKEIIESTCGFALLELDLNFSLLSPAGSPCRHNLMSPNLNLFENCHNTTYFTELWRELN